MDIERPVTMARNGEEPRCPQENETEEQRENEIDPTATGRRWEVDLTSEISEDEEDLITRLYKLLGESQVGSDSWEATLEDQGAGRIILEGQNWERTSRATAHLQPRMILPSRGRCRLYESCYAIPLY
ncbi:uncharacterized protein LOC18445161 isoform X1 [Amborella trichopoda]|uniref:uncharacterized protein LOC18445161 isoform X1 n=1 Tax=Amborella trichopoda TaxID=13333 RepID=UPI0009C19369|nr:uncharacterized protein LOC18445161 isoform X1 [Amborella trichopoda]|eukprot:XP_020529722.1 uncharacterized protein LOC18445161 isoform X1 [Amborella trichopoda]